MDWRARQPALVRRAAETAEQLVARNEAVHDSALWMGGTVSHPARKSDMLASQSIRHLLHKRRASQTAVSHVHSRRCLFFAAHRLCR